MAAGSRRFATRLALALLAFGTALSASAGGAPADAANNPLTIVAHVGYSDVVKVQQWMPISIAITNTGPAIDGTLEIQAVFGPRAGAWPASYQSSLVLATGTTKHFRSYVVEESSGYLINVRIVSNGRVLASQDAAPTHIASTLIGVLSDDSTALDDFALLHAAPNAPTVVHLGLADIAESPIALRAFDLLAVDDFATDGLNAGQRTAISEYVKGGGSLLVGTGASWRRTVAGLPADILPMELTGLTTLNASSALGGLAEVQVASGTLTGGTAWLSDGGQPLITEKPVGTGLVTLATFDWKQDPIPAWSGTMPLLRQAFVRTTFAAQQTSATINIGPFIGPFGGQGNSTYDRSGNLSQALASLPALDTPSLALTGVLVLLYVLLVGPINFLVLGALHRRALAWVTLPVIAVVVAAAAYGGGILTKGQSVQTNQVSIIHVQPNSDSAYQETYTGILTPTRGDYVVGTGGRPLLVSPISSSNPFDGSNQAGIEVSVENGDVTLPGMTAFTLRGFATEGMIAAPQLLGHLQLINGQLTGSIENRSSVTFTDAVVIAGDGYQKLGALAPGASAAVGFVPRSIGVGGPPAALSIYPNYSFGPQSGPPTDAQRSGETKTRILSMLEGAGFKGMPSAVGVPLLIAWTGHSFGAVTVNGGHPRAHNQTAVAVALPIEQLGAGPVPTGLVGPRIIDFEGSTVQQGPPGTNLVENGNVTFKFAPPLAPGLQLSGASLNASNPVYLKGPTSSNGSTSSIRGEAWDWSQATWVDIAYKDTGTTALPAAVINPGTGEVRLRVIVSNGSFLPSGISLSGTVQ